MHAVRQRKRVTEARSGLLGHRRTKLVLAGALHARAHARVG